MLRRSLFPLLLITLLLFAQQLLVQHPYTHLENTSRINAIDQEKNAPAQLEACDTCALLADIGSTLLANSASLPLAVTFIALSASAEILVATPQRFPYQSRAPPALA